MIWLRFDEVIVFYEVPQVFVAIDAFDSKYLCLLYPSDDDVFRYIAVKISASRLDQFKGKIIDLLSIYQDSEEGQYYDVELCDAEEIHANPIPANAVQPFMLPDAGFYCEYDAINNDELIAHSLHKGKIMSCIAFSDRNNSHDIDVNVLTHALDRYQAMVRNCHIKLHGKQYGSEATMRACALQAASFDVHFVLDETFDMFGESARVSATLDKLDEILNETDEEALREKVDSIKGHALRSMRSFLQVLDVNKLSFKHKWVKSTLECSVSGSSITLDNISKVYEFLNTNQELEDVEKEFTGYFGTASVLDKGKWTFILEDKKKINGTDDIGLTNGLTVGPGKTYKIRCTEYQEQDQVTSTIKHTYKLIACTPC